MNYKYIGILIIALFSLGIFALAENVNAKDYYTYKNESIKPDYIIENHGTYTLFKQNDIVKWKFDPKDYCSKLNSNPKDVNALFLYKIDRENVLVNAGHDTFTVKHDIKDKLIEFDIIYSSGLWGWNRQYINYIIYIN